MNERLKFILSESYKTVKRYPLFTIISSLTIGVSLILFSFAVYMYNVTDNISKTFKEDELEIDLFFKNTIEVVEAEQICDEIVNSFSIPNFSFTNREELFSNISDPELKKWLESESLDFVPCKCSFHPNSDSIDNLDVVIKTIEVDYSDKIDTIIYPRSYLSKFEKLINNLYSIVFILGAIILAMCILNISNVIRLTMEARKNTITILKLHGASNAIVRAPFLLEGFYQGILGAILSIVIIIIVTNMNLLIDYNHFLIRSLASTISISSYIFLNLICGILLGLLSSSIGLSSYLDKD